MNIGVLSDTHGNDALMLAAARFLTEELGADRLFHLGDDYADAETLRAYDFQVTAVPGLWCPEYLHPHIRKRWVEDIDGLTLVAVHAAKDLLPKDWDADVLLTGHTHRATVERLGKVLHLNPGHLKSLKDRESPASFGFLRIAPHEILAAIYDHAGVLKRELQVMRVRYA